MKRKVLFLTLVLVLGFAAWAFAAEATEAEKVRAVLAELAVERLASDLMESHKAAEIGCLQRLGNAELKGLLRRVIGKIFNDFEMMGCCNDREAGYDLGSESGRASSG